MKPVYMKVALKPNGPGPYETNKIYECEIMKSLTNDVTLYHIPCPDADAHSNEWTYSKTFSTYYFKKYFMTISELRKTKLEKIFYKYKKC